MSLKEDRKNEFGLKFLGSEEADIATTFYDMAGRELNVVEFYEKVADGKRVNAMDKDGNFVKCYMDYAPVKIDESKVQPINMNAQANILKAQFHELNKQINDTTHWYMKSSKEFKEFRECMKALENGDLSDPAFVKAQTEKVIKSAEAYLNFKERDGTEITKNTEKRINVASMVAVNLRSSLALAAHKAINLDAEDEKEMTAPNGGSGKVLDLDEDEVMEANDDEIEFVAQVKDSVSDKVAPTEVALDDDDDIKFIRSSPAKE